ncbi:sce7726 family protein [Mesorhizobium sp. M0296]|uniref:sce7726 family protein n=1 Tax=Mesorhizobium sp. M0296 TaxID=2956931 RepID=UPI00333D1449
MRDADVRRAIKFKLDALHKDDPSTRIVEEMGVWGSTVRVDMAVINGELSGYELKSNADTVLRLPYQVEIYNKVFDRMTLVVGDKLADKALPLIPAWWGCTVATMQNDQIRLTLKRKGRKNPSLDLSVVVQMLWREEAISALEAHGLADGWRTKRSAEIANRLLTSLSPKQLSDEVRKALKARMKLGQLATGKLNMPVDAVCDPSGRATC